MNSIFSQNKIYNTDLELNWQVVNGVFNSIGEYFIFQYAPSVQNIINLTGYSDSINGDISANNNVSINYLVVGGGGGGGSYGGGGGGGFVTGETIVPIGTYIINVGVGGTPYVPLLEISELITGSTYVIESYSVQDDFSLSGTLVSGMVNTPGYTFIYNGVAPIWTHRSILYSILGAGSNGGNSSFNTIIANGGGGGGTPPEAAAGVGGDPG